jgi:hypothetical protein
MTTEQFRQYNNHYDQVANAEFGQAVFNAFQAVDHIALDSEIVDFIHKLWQGGFKIIPVDSTTADAAKHDSPADVASNCYVVPASVINATDDEITTYQPSDETEYEMSVTWTNRKGTPGNWLPSDYKADKILALRFES